MLLPLICVAITKLKNKKTDPISMATRRSVHIWEQIIFSSIRYVRKTIIISPIIYGTSQ